MKRLITILLLHSITVNATTYYISSAGSDAATGTSASQAWQTLDKINSFTFAAGDNILFKRGDTFYGMLSINQSGSSGSPITYGAYGTGANPIITGFTTVITWTNVGSNIWQSSSTVSTLSACNMVVINGINTAMGRYPNTGWLTYQSFSGNTSITSSSLTGTPDWTGASAVIKKFRYVIDVANITAQSGGTLTYTGGSANDGQNNYGFFIQNDVRTLDQQNEWYYNGADKKISVYSTSEPTNVKLATRDTLVYIVNKSYITFDGIDFTGANGQAFYLGNAAHLTIQNCAFDFNYNAIKGYQFGGSSSSLLINNCTVNHSNNNGIDLPSEFAGATITYNTVNNTGLLEGMAASGQSRWGVNLTGNNYTVTNNSIDSTGYVGIGFNGSSVLVDRNFVNNFCITTDDGSGVYTGNNQTAVVISNNIVLNGIGNYSGTTYTTPSANGIYCDDNSSGMQLLNNSVANVAFAAIFLHQAKDIEVRGNTTFNSHIGLLVDRDNTVEHTTGIAVKKNIFVGNSSGTMNTLADQICIWFKTKYTTAGDIAAFGTVDSNYYARPIDDGNTIMGTVYGVADTYYTLASWQAYTGFDANSHKSPKSITDANDLRFEYAGASSKTISLPYQYLSATSASFSTGSITLAPYTSAVLIKNGALVIGSSSYWKSKVRRKFKNE